MSLEQHDVASLGIGVQETRKVKKIFGKKPDGKTVT
jgi:hypothetical protein